MDFWKLKNKQHKSLVGLELRTDGIAIAAKNEKSNACVIEHLAFLEGDSQEERVSLLKNFVKDNKLSKKPCNVVLSPGNYQILLIEAPDVPEQEMADAIRWRLKDLIQTPPDKTAIEVFNLPADGSSSGKKMVYVVASELDYLQSIVDIIKRVDLSLVSIDIGEMAMRNLAIHLVDPRFEGSGIAIARIRENMGSIAVFKKGNLYLSRQFGLNYNAGLLDDLPVETLALELQRSLDYYERQMAQAAPGVIYICGDNVSEDKVTEQLQNSLASSIQYLDLRATVAMCEESDSNILQVCSSATGASLRKEYKHAAG